MRHIHICQSVNHQSINQSINHTFNPLNGSYAQDNKKAIGANRQRMEVVESMMSHLRDTPPCLLLRMIGPLERTGGMGTKGRVGWVQRPDGSRPWFHKSERTHSAKGNSSRDSSSSREAPDTAGNLGSVTPAREAGRKKNAHRTP